jgi:hypothetical protein
MNPTDRRWKASTLYADAVSAFILRKGSESLLDFKYSQEFRDARLAFRKTVNHSWEIEST